MIIHFAAQDNEDFPAVYCKAAQSAGWAGALLRARPLDFTQACAAATFTRPDRTQTAGGLYA